jgi:hypothetical protein
MMAQYAPQAGQTGTTAIHADSSIFTGWVTSCTANLGYQNILDSSLGLVASGSTNSVLGKADGFDVLSLGDAGEAICRFESPIKDLPGWDFAVFENAFSTFLELAYVEVSSNGIDYYRFPSFSITQDTAQVGTFGALEAHHIHNLAGKYHGYYGTPFDLHELENEIGLDINYITHVKIVDVVGRIIEPYNNQDSEGNVINDPWPTPFNQGGFDLDAIGVIHQVPTSLDEEKSVAVKLYPNPIKDFLTIEGGQGIEMENPQRRRT